jgi:hypothetical protein
MSSNTKMVLIPLDRYEILMKKDQSKLETSNGSVIEVNKDECDELSEQDIISFMPEESRNTAKLVLRHMKSNHIFWNKCGQLVLDNDCVTDANVIEVLRDVINGESDKIESSASRQFYKLLVMTHFPLSLLSKRNGINSD